MIPRNVIICLTVLATIGFFILGIVLTSFSIASYSDCSGKDYIPTTVYQCVNNKYGSYCASAYKPCIFNNGTNIITNCSDFCDGCYNCNKSKIDYYCNCFNIQTNYTVLNVDLLVGSMGFGFSFIYLVILLYFCFSICDICCFVKSYDSV